MLRTAPVRPPPADRLHRLQDAFTTAADDSRARADRYPDQDDANAVHPVRDGPPRYPGRTVAHRASPAGLGGYWRPMTSDRATRLRRLARTLTDRFGFQAGGPHRHGAVEAEWSASARAWTFAWTDGPTVAQVRAACLETEPTASEGLRYARTLSEDAVALGAVRLTVSPVTDANRRPFLSPADIEALLKDEPSPAPRTDRERALVYAVLYEIHDADHRNQAQAEEICNIVNRYGLAMFLRRSGAELSPVEVLTAHYAATHAHPPWRHRLAPMDAVVLFRAVREDLRATTELVTAALALLPGLPAEYAAAEGELRSRLEHAVSLAQSGKDGNSPFR
ncbi:hypothetical protein [Streptomyces sp. ML-6]|uniref:hypothetical protein n=1 Tax=Streptomyces sp. ML-6 TaxID=2982693 RepID=UPI0024BF3BEB|nr:hypothetical protein [Streptomyces sp. ML-6]MDK0517685.1 hypothetical protein [Streptomyces sp. ML-6]